MNDMKLKSELTTFVFLAFLFSSALLLQAADKVPIKIPKVEGSIHVNGVLDDPVWQKALKLDINNEVQPGENITPPVKTEVFLAYTKTHLYVAYKAYDPRPSEIRAHLTDRDNIFNDDFVAMNLDTFNDQRRIYTFLCNPLGIQGDMIETDTVSDASWDGIWGSAGRITDDGFIVEISIPFSSLRFQNKEGDQVWGFDLVRYYPRNFSYVFNLSPRDRNNPSVISQLPKLIGFDGARAGKSIEIDPSVSGVYTQERGGENDDKWIEKTKKLKPGFTAHWGFTPNMALSAAVNPDFSQVEADVAQLDINLQYAIYYPEKRPFFMEGSSIFDTRVTTWKLANPVYTRALAEPDWGIKLTGKQGRHSIGFFSVQDHITNLLFPGVYLSDSTSLNQKNISSVLRYRLDVGRQTSTIGFLATDREGDHYYNRVVGGDFFFRITTKKWMKTQFLTSSTSYPAEVATTYSQPKRVLSGSLFDFVFRHESRNIGYYVNYRQVSPEFRADLGYLPHVGFRYVNAVMIFASWRAPGHWYTFMNLTPSIEYEEDFNKKMLQKNIKLAYNYEGSKQISYYLTGILGKKSFFGTVFDVSQVINFFQIQPTGQLNINFALDFGNQIDFDNIRQGTNIIFNPGIVWKVGRHFLVNLDHAVQWFKADSVRLYTGNVSNLKFVYQFSGRAFLRAILQYERYNFNLDNYTFPWITKYKHLFTQILFSYKINPQTMLFLGYSDDHSGVGNIHMRQSNRTLFLKIGYAIVI